MTWVHSPNSASFQDTAGSPLALGLPESTPEPSATSSGTSIPRRSLQLELSMGDLTTPPSGTISNPSTGDLGVDSWISSLAGSRVSHTPQLESVLENKIAETSGLTPLGSYGKWNPDTSSWRMSEDWLTGLSHTQRKSLGVFPRQGTMRSGDCAVLPRQAHPTRESVGGVWPTPVAQDDNKSPEAHMRMKANMKGGPRKKPTSLNVMVKGIEEGRWVTPNKLWPTPHANKHTSNVANMDDLVNSDGTPWIPGRKPYNRKSGKQVTTTLHDLVRWPTPHANASTGPGTQGREGGTDLQTTVFHTPSATDWKGKPGQRRAQLTDDIQDRGMLNPDWVEWLMGLPQGWTGLDKIERYTPWDATWWLEEPDIPRVSRGVANRVSRLKAIGNGIVPAVVREFLKGE